MDQPNPNRGFCRRFLGGICNFGDRCRYRHERPTQICRHFQKGRCWFGSSCKFLHVLPPERRVSEQSVPPFPIPFNAAPGQPDRGNPLTTPNMSRSQSNGQTSAEGRSQEIPNVSTMLVQDIEHRQPNTRSEELEGATAAPETANLAQAIDRSNDFTCGICLENIFEKRIPKFGILPNCTHSFCLECIQSWRKTRDLLPEVVKSCPVCRVSSGYYVPHDQWVEGREKEILIAAFKKKFKHKTCTFFLRHGHCPFKSDCLYRHDRTLARPSFEIPEGLTSDVLGFLIAMAFSDSEDEDDEDDDYSADDEDNINLIDVLSTLGFF